jgi:catechol 2,3-dioxygenase-like lactoylglutathione lyase family enzyme
MTNPFPTPGMELTQILVVRDVERAKRFYVDVLGATLYREYGGTSVVLRFLDNWILLVTGGPPTPDKPTVTFAAPADADTVSRAWTIRVPDCQAAHDALLQRGARFLAPPLRNGPEMRCFLRDPDGNLIELSEYTAGGSSAE